MSVRRAAGMVLVTAWRIGAAMVEAAGRKVGRAVEVVKEGRTVGVGRGAMAAAAACLAFGLLGCSLRGLK